jgi:hypothetical protein
MSESLENRLTRLETDVVLLKRSHDMTGYEWVALLSVAIMAGSLIVVILKITRH